MLTKVNGVENGERRRMVEFSPM